jgi:hypothetical protein
MFSNFGSTYFYSVKKSLLTILLVCYAIASFGVNIHYFYCCGKLKTVSLVVTHQEKQCKPDEPKGCCDNKTVTVKLKTDQKENDQPVYQFTAPVTTASFYNSTSVAAVPISNSIHLLYQKPPPLPLPDLHVLFCVFRI